MKLVFTRGMICCGCNKRFFARNVKVTYKSVCICGKCLSEFCEYGNKSYMRGMQNTMYTMAAFQYSGLFREIFLRYKFNGAFAYGHLLGMLVGEHFRTRVDPDEFDCIVTVPLSKQRTNERGYNQSDLLADYISAATGIPIEKGLVRIRNTEHQSKMRGYERTANVCDAFRGFDNVRDKRVMLFDDVITTGNTIAQCAKALGQAGAKSVVAAAAACAAFFDETLIDEDDEGDTL